MICSRPMNTLSTKYSKSWSRVSGVSMVASAPGVGVTASAIAVDITTFLAAATRLVAHTAAYYGYDSEDPTERLFSTMVLSQAIDPTGSGHDFVVEKQTTMLAFNKVMRDLARRGSSTASAATWS